AAEVGRQPWIVYPTLVNGVLEGGLRTSDAISEAVKAEQVFGSIVMFALIYILLFILWVVVLNHKIQKGPAAVEPESEADLRGYLDAAARRVAHEASMTEAKE